MDIGKLDITIMNKPKPIKDIQSFIKKKKKKKEKKEKKNKKKKKKEKRKKKKKREKKKSVAVGRKRNAPA